MATDTSKTQHLGWAPLLLSKTVSVLFCCKILDTQAIRSKYFFGYTNKVHKWPVNQAIEDVVEFFSFDNDKKRKYGVFPKNTVKPFNFDNKNEDLLLWSKTLTTAMNTVVYNFNNQLFSLIIVI